MRYHEQLNLYGNGMEYKFLRIYFLIAFVNRIIIFSLHQKEHPRIWVRWERALFVVIKL